MTARDRIRKILPAEKLERNRKFAERIGVTVVSKLKS